MPLPKIGFCVGDKVRIKANTLEGLIKSFSQPQYASMVATFKSELTILRMVCGGNGAEFQYLKGASILADMFYIDIHDLEHVEARQYVAPVKEVKSVESNEHCCNSRICLHEKESNG